MCEEGHMQDDPMKSSSTICAFFYVILHSYVKVQLYVYLLCLPMCRHNLLCDN
eukprot:c45045_g1_i1 orf=77-235(+)